MNKKKHHKQDTKQYKIGHKTEDKYMIKILYDKDKKKEHKNDRKVDYVKEKKLEDRKDLGTWRRNST